MWWLCLVSVELQCSNYVDVVVMYARFLGIGNRGVAKGLEDD